MIIFQNYFMILVSNPKVGTRVLMTPIQSVIILPIRLTSHHKETWSIGSYLFETF